MKLRYLWALYFEIVPSNAISEETTKGESNMNSYSPIYFCMFLCFFSHELSLVQQTRLNFMFF